VRTIESTTVEKTIHEICVNIPAAPPELHTDANAIADRSGNEANATTGWNIAGSPTLSSTTLNPHTGSYHFVCVVQNNTSGESIYKNIGDDCNLQIGITYRLNFWAYHYLGVNTAPANYGLNSSVTGITTLLGFTSGGIFKGPYYNEVVDFTYDGTNKYLVFESLSGLDGSIFEIDNLSIIRL
jgi:hypothetical protein